MGGGTSTLLPATGFPGSSRGAVLALRLARHKPQSEKTHRRSAWPPGTRSPFKVSEGGLPPIKKPLAGAIARYRKSYGNQEDPKWGALPERHVRSGVQPSHIYTPRTVHLIEISKSHHTAGVLSILKAELLCVQEAGPHFSSLAHTFGVQCIAAD